MKDDPEKLGLENDQNIEFAGSTMLAPRHQATAMRKALVRGYRRTSAP
jgi:hypothetical protein